MRTIIIGLGALTLALAGAAIAETQFPPLKRVPLLEQPLPPAEQPRYVKGGRVDFAPGQPTGLHRHPAAVIGIVTRGSFRFQPEGQELRTLKTGDAFYEPAGVRILHFDNASGTEPAQISAFYLLDRADQPVIEMLDGK